MEKYQGVAITDGVNRKNHILPLNSIIKAYRDTWNTVIPMNLGHDRTKPIGYTMLTGVYMEPGKAYVTNESAIMETDEEYEKMREIIMAYDYKIFCEEHRKELDTLINKLGCILSDKFRVAPVGQAVAIKDKNIVDTVTLLKYLKRKGLRLRMPITTMIAFNDMIFNFPTLCCKSLHVADIAITAIKELC